jgi:hypothetical protein
VGPVPETGYAEESYVKVRGWEIRRLKKIV